MNGSSSHYLSPLWFFSLVKWIRRLPCMTRVISWKIAHRRISTPAIWLKNFQGYSGIRDHDVFCVSLPLFRSFLNSLNYRTRSADSFNVGIGVYNYSYFNGTIFLKKLFCFLSHSNNERYSNQQRIMYVRFDINKFLLKLCLLFFF